MGTQPIDRNGAQRANEAKGNEEYSAIHRSTNPRVADPDGPSWQMSRPRLALLAKQFDQQRATDVEPLGHLRIHLRVELHLLTRIACSRLPTRLAGMMKIGSTISDSTVSRHSNMAIVAKVVTSTTTLLTTLPRVLVTADWAPTTSLFSRLIKAPVWVRVKKAMGIRSTLSNKRDAQVVDQSFTDSRRVPALYDRQRRISQCRKSRDAGKQRDLVAVLVRDAVIEDVAEQQRGDQRQQGRDQDCQSETR